MNTLRALKILSKKHRKATEKFSKAQIEEGILRRTDNPTRRIEEETNRRFASIATIRPGCGGGIIDVFYNKSDLNLGRYSVVGDQPISLSVSTIVKINQ